MESRSIWSRRVCTTLSICAATWRRTIVRTKSHQTRRLAQLPTPDRLDHDDKGIVNLVVQFLGAQLAAQIEPDSLGKELIKLLHAVGFAQSDPVNQYHPFGVGFRFLALCRGFESPRFGARAFSICLFPGFSSSRASCDLIKRPIGWVGAPGPRADHFQLAAAAGPRPAKRVLQVVVKNGRECRRSNPYGP